MLNLPHNRALSSPAFSPRHLFDAGEQGAWFDPSDLSTLYQKTTDASPNVGIGDPVGRILDKSGNGNHATQTNDGSRPTLQRDGNGLFYLSFDGVDDGLATGSISWPGQQINVFSGARKAADGPYPVLVENFDNANFRAFTIHAADSSGNTGIGGYLTSSSNNTIGGRTGALTSPVTFVNYTFFDASKTTIAAGGLLIRTNGVEQTLTNTSGGTFSAGTFSSSVINIGRRVVGGLPSLPLNGRIYSLILRGAPSIGVEIVATEAWINRKTGAY